MGADTIKIATSLVMLAAFVGVLSVVLTNPKSSNAVLAAGTTTIAGVVSDLEGKPVKA